jgi:hypothetical protein
MLAVLFWNSSGVALAAPQIGTGIEASVNTLESFGTLIATYTTLFTSGRWAAMHAQRPIFHPLSTRFPRSVNLSRHRNVAPVIRRGLELHTRLEALPIGPRHTMRDPLAMRPSFSGTGSGRRTDTTIRGTWPTVTRLMPPPATARRAVLAAEPRAPIQPPGEGGNPTPIRTLPPSAAPTLRPPTPTCTHANTNTHSRGDAGPHSSSNADTDADPATDLTTSDDDIHRAVRWPGRR